MPLYHTGGTFTCLDWPPRPPIQPPPPTLAQSRGQRPSTTMGRVRCSKASNLALKSFLRSANVNLSVFIEGVGGL